MDQATPTQVYRKDQFSTPKMEELFKVLFDISEGNNIMLKKNIVELVEHTKLSIDEEMTHQQKQIADKNERIAELKSAFDGLKIQPKID